MKDIDRKIEVTLFPMVHVGEREFFETVRADAFEHDGILLEGVKARWTRAITASYRWLDFGKLGLVKQPRIAPDGAGPPVRINADLPPDAFWTRWKRIAWWMRFLLVVAAPLYGIYLRFSATRESLVKQAGNRNVLRDPEEILDEGNELEAFREAFRHARDEHLIGVLVKTIEASPPGHRIAVIFGASHIPPVVRALSARGLRFGNPHWMTIISLNDWTD